MKKLLYVLLAMTIAFAMISCDTGGGGGKKDTILLNGGTSVGQGETEQYSLTVNGTVQQGATWTLSGNTEQTTTLVSGLLSVAVAETVGTNKLLVKVVSADGKITREKQVSVVETFEVSFLPFTGGTVLATKYRLQEGASFTSKGLSLPSAGPRADFAFNRWEKTVAGAQVEFTADTTVDADVQLVGAWWSTLLTTTASDAIEKVWLGNTQYPVYAFALGANDVEDIVSITGTFALSEAEIEAIAAGKKNLRPLRAMGPYFLNDDADETVTNGNSLFFGDFAIDANGAYAAKFNDQSAVTLAQFNKFHPYLLSNNTIGISVLANADPTASPAVAGTKPTADAWFNVTIPTSGYDWGGGRTIAKNLEELETAGKTTMHGDNADYTTVYFGIGLATDGNVHDAARGNTADVFRHGITSVVKEVKINFSDGTSVTGTIPSFDKYDVTWGGDAPPTLDATPSGTTDQVFASYIYAVQYNWRGAASAAVAIPVDPTYAYDNTRPPPATADYIVENPTMTFFGNDKKKDNATPGCLTLVNGTATAAYGANDFDDGAGLMGGAGIWIALPDNFRAYDDIIIDYVATVESDSTSTAQFTVKQGQGVFSPNKGNGAYKDIEAGTKQFIGTDWNTENFTSATDPTKPGISFQVNNWQGTNCPQNWTFKITKLTLKKPEVPWNS